jgi:FMN reductase
MRARAHRQQSLVAVTADEDGADGIRRLADLVIRSVGAALTAAGTRCEVQVLALHRLAADLAQHAAQGDPTADLREALTVVQEADALVVTWPWPAGAAGTLDRFLAALPAGSLTGTPVVLAVALRSAAPVSGVGRSVRDRLVRLGAGPVPPVVVAGERGAPDGDARLLTEIERAAADLVR